MTAPARIVTSPNQLLQPRSRPHMTAPAAALQLLPSWFEDYNTHHPHSGLKMRSPREFIAAQTATA